MVGIASEGNVRRQPEARRAPAATLLSVGAFDWFNSRRTRYRDPLPRDVYLRAKIVMLDHQARWDGSCFCGWDEEGKSYAEHVIAELRAAGVRFVLDEDDQ